MKTVLRNQEGYYVALKRVKADISSGDVRFPLEIREGKIALPWGEEVLVPEAPPPPGFEPRKKGIVPVGFTAQETVVVKNLVGDATINVAYTYEYVLTVAIVERRWEDWTWRGVEGDNQVVFESPSFSVRLPLSEAALGTREEYEYLCTHKIFFHDLNGDSMMSNSYHAYWTSRLRWLEEKLGIQKPPEPLPPKKKEFKLALTGLASADRGRARAEHATEGDRVFLLFGGRKILTPFQSVITMDWNPRDPVEKKGVVLGKEMVAIYEK